MQTATKPLVFSFVNEGTLKKSYPVISEATEQKRAVDKKSIHWLHEAKFVDYTSESSISVMVQSKIFKLEEKVAYLESKLADLESCIVQDSFDEVELRDLPYDQAKKEIRQFFSDHHGEHFDAADIQERLGIEIDLAIDVLDVLREEGKIK